MAKKKLTMQRIRLTKDVDFGAQQKKKGEEMMYPRTAATALRDAGKCEFVKEAVKAKKAAPKAEEPVAEDEEGEEIDLKEVVTKALENGKKDALIEALEAVGIDHGTLTNNDDRKDALEKFLKRG